MKTVFPFDVEVSGSRPTYVIARGSNLPKNKQSTGFIFNRIAIIVGLASAVVVILKQSGWGRVYPLLVLGY